MTTLLTKLIGCAFLALPFIVTFAIIAHFTGVRVALKAFGLTALIASSIHLGCYLLTK